MAMGNRPSERQVPLFVATGTLAQSPGHPFYERMNALFAEEGFDRFVEARCARFYACSRLLGLALGLARALRALPRSLASIRAVLLPDLAPDDEHVIISCAA